MSKFVYDRVKREVCTSNECIYWQKGDKCKFEAVDITRLGTCLEGKRKSVSMKYDGDPPEGFDDHDGLCGYCPDQEGCKLPEPSNDCWGDKLIQEDERNMHFEENRRASK